MSVSIHKCTKHPNKKEVQNYNCIWLTMNGLEVQSSIRLWLIMIKWYIICINQVLITVKDLQLDLKPPSHYCLLTVLVKFQYKFRMVS